MATRPPLSEIVETPIEQSPGETPRTPNKRPVVNTGPEFIEQPIERAPSAPTSGGGPLAFLDNIDRTGAILRIHKALGIIVEEPTAAMLGCNRGVSRLSRFRAVSQRIGFFRFAAAIDLQGALAWR